MIKVQQSDRQRHGGFTMIELLMVVAILAVLVGLSISVMSGVIQQAEEEATKTTVLKINRLLEQRVEAYERAFKGSRKDSYIRGAIALLAAHASGRFEYFQNHPEEAPPEIKILAYKAGFRFEFPQRMVELTVLGGDTNNDGIPDNIYNRLLVPFARQQLITEGENPSAPGFNTLVTTRATTNWGVHTAHEAAVNAATGGASSTGSSSNLHSTESSELLYFILTQSGTFGSTPVDSDQFGVNELADTDGDGMLEFVDAWGNPFRFYRWPTRLISPAAPNPFNPIFSDVSDPTDVDLTPDNTADPGSTGTRRVTGFERELAGILMKGLPPTPTPLGASTPRDVLLIDPDDPVGLLYTFLENQKYKDMDINVAGEFNEAKYHTPDTYHSPLVVSAGADGLLGLREPNDTDATSGVFGNLAQYAGTSALSALAADPNVVSGVVDSLFDNITNRNRRAGGRR